MNRKLAIFGFSIIWIATIATILFVLLPKLLVPKVVNTNMQNGEESADLKINKKNQVGDSFFYDKKVFVRHKTNTTDSTSDHEQIIFIRENIFFKPPSLKVKPVIKEAPKKKDNSDFDIKPVPSS